jgi:hypothetical protein
LESGLPAEFRPRATRELALMAKRRGNHDQAVALWHELVNDPDDGVHACEQLAIYYERRAKDIPRAKEFAQLGVTKIARSRALMQRYSVDSRAVKTEKTFLHRLARLDRR